MKKRLGSRSRRAPIPPKYMFIISLLIFLGLTFQTFYYVEKNIQPTVREIARIRAEQLANDAIHEAINKKTISEVNFKDLVHFQKDNGGKIQVASFDNKEYLRIVMDATENVAHSLEKMEAVPQTLPLGQALGSSLLAQFGPKLQLTLVPFGSVHVEMDIKMKQAGINMVLVTVIMTVQTKVKIVIPFSTQPALVQTEIPISSALIVGSVPQFYYDGAGKPIGSEVPGVQPPSILPPVQADSTKIEN
jgi:sporulation protein YunB